VRAGRALLLTTVSTLLAERVVAQSVPVTVSPSPPPGVGEAVSRILSWIMWIGWIAVAAAFIVGAIHFAMGDSEKGKRCVAGAIMGAIIMAFYTAIIAGLVG